MISYHSAQGRSLPLAGKAIRRIREKALVPRGIGVVAKWDILF
jgi:hypothetical protein